MTAKLVLGVVVSLFAMAVASVVVHVLGLGKARIEVVAVVVVWACLSLDTTRAAFCSFAAGYLFDLMSGSPTGLYPLVAMLTFAVCRVAVAMVDVSHPAGFAVLCGVIDCVHQLLAWGLIALFVQAGAHSILAAIPATASLTALGGLALYPIFHRLDLAFDREESSVIYR